MLRYIGSIFRLKSFLNDGPFLLDPISLEIRYFILSQDPRRGLN